MSGNGNAASHAARAARRRDRAGFSAAGRLRPPHSRPFWDIASRAIHDRHTPYQAETRERCNWVYEFQTMMSKTDRHGRLQRVGIRRRSGLAETI